jgi:hypothetical protein
MGMLTLYIMVPVLGWYLFTISSPERGSRRDSAGDLDRESVRLPRRRRFPRALSRRNGIEYRSVRRHHRRTGASLTAHPMWDRWIDG